MKYIFLNIKLVILVILFGLISCENNKPKEAVKESPSLAFCSDITLSENEQKVDIKLEVLRKQFLDQCKAKKYSFFNHSFEENRHLIDTSKLFKLIKEMPKGSLLHSHSKGLTNMYWLINTLKKYPNCYVYTGADTKEHLFGTLMIFNNNQVPFGFVNLAKILKTNAGFYDKLYDSQVFRRFKLDSDIEFWPEFEKRFARIGNITSYRPFFYEYHKKAFQDLLADNVDNIEIRYIFEPLFDRNNRVFPVDTAVKDLKRLIGELKKTSPDFEVQLIYTSLKFLDKNTVKKEYAKAFEMRKKYPDLISGFDLVAEEDAGHDIDYFHSVWLKTDSLSDIYKVDMPIYMHAGESNSISNENIAQSLNSMFVKRIGHGLNLVLFPEMIEKVKNKNILVELNPLSNQILGYVNNLQNHPARILLSKGVQCAISSDDPGVFGYEGLSYDYFTAFMAWELDLKALKKLVFNSIEYSSMPPKDKPTALKTLENNWSKFILKGLVDF